MKTLDGVQLTHDIRIMKNGKGYYAEKRFLFWWAFAGVYHMLFGEKAGKIHNDVTWLKQGILKKYSKPVEVKE